MRPSGLLLVLVLALSPVFSTICAWQCVDAVSHASHAPQPQADATVPAGTALSSAEHVHHHAPEPAVQLRPAPDSGRPAAHPSQTPLLTAAACCATPVATMFEPRTARPQVAAIVTAIVLPPSLASVTWRSATMPTAAPAPVPDRSPTVLRI